MGEEAAQVHLHQGMLALHRQQERSMYSHPPGELASAV